MGRRRRSATLTPASLREVMRDEIGKAMSGAPRTAANPTAQAAGMTSTPDTFGQLAQLMRAAVGYRATPMARDPRDSGPFGPMHPMPSDAISPSRTDTGRPEPWLYEYPVAWNIPGQGERLMPWRVLDAAARNIDVIRRCIEIRKSRVRTAPWSWDISPQAIEDAYRADGTKGHDDIASELRDKYRADINRLTEFWKRPWRVQGLDFGNWVGGIMEGRLKYDAVVVYPRMNLGGDTLLGLEIIDPTTVKPLLDYRGSRPEPPFPAFQQILYGFPRGEWRATATETVNEDGSTSVTIDGAFRADELVYLRENYQLNSPYGYGPTEQALVASRLWMRRQGWLLAEYTDGVTPQLIWEVPTEAAGGAGLTPEQRMEWESSVNDELAGQTGERHRSKVGFPGMVPHLMPSVDERYKPDYDLFLLKLQCSFFGVPVTDLGFSESKGLGSTGMHAAQAENRADIATAPDLLFITDLTNDLGHHYQNAPAELVFSFTDNDGGQDESQSATIRVGEVNSGQKTLNDTRRELSLPVYQFPEADKPFVMGQNGPVFIEGSLAASQRAQGLDANGKPLPPGQAPGEQPQTPPGDAQPGDNPGEKPTPGSGDNVDKAAASAPPLCRQIRAQLAPDYPDAATMWIKDANWTGPVDVPPNHLDLDAVKTWDAYGDTRKVNKFRKLIHKTGALKPIVAVTVPGDDRVKVVDGHHRALAAVREGVPVRAYVGAVGKKIGPWTSMHATQHPGGHHGEVDGAAPTTGAPAGAAKFLGPHEPSHEARAEIGAYHRWAAKATTGGRPFVMKAATPDDFPDGVPAGVEFADWIWLGFDNVDLVKAYEPWWPRGTDGRWVKRGSFAGLEDKIRELHSKHGARVDASDRRIIAARDRASGARLRLSHTTDPEQRRGLLAEINTHEATIADERAKRAKHVAAQRDSAATVLRRHEAEQRKAESAANRATVGTMETPADTHDRLLAAARRGGPKAVRTELADQRHPLSDQQVRDLVAHHESLATGHGVDPDRGAVHAALRAEAKRRNLPLAITRERRETSAERRAAIPAPAAPPVSNEELAAEGRAQRDATRRAADEAKRVGRAHMSPVKDVKSVIGSGRMGADPADLRRGLRARGYTAPEADAAIEQALQDPGVERFGDRIRRVPAGAHLTPPDVGAVRDAYAAAAGTPGQYVPLADIRDRLPDLTRAEQDAALTHLARTDRSVHVDRWDDQKVLSARERAASLPMGGRDNHVLRIDPGPASSGNPVASARAVAPADHEAALLGMNTRAEADAYLADIKGKELDALLAHLDLGRSGSAEYKRSQISQQLVGARLNSQAIRTGGSAGSDPLPTSPVTDMRAAYARLREPGEWASIADLRDQTPHLTRDQQDLALRRIEQMDDANVVPESNQKALSERERAAAVVIGDQPKHLVMIGGSSLGGGPPASMTRPRVGGPPSDVVAAKLRGVTSRDEAHRYLDGLGLKVADYRRLGRELDVPFGSGASKTEMRRVMVEVLAGSRLDADAIMHHSRAGKAAESDPKGQPPGDTPPGAPQPPPDDRWPGWMIDVALTGAVSIALTRALTRGVDIRAVARAAARQWPDAAPSAAEVVSWLGDRYGQGLADALTPAIEDALTEGYLVGAKSAEAILDAGVDPRNPGISLTVDWSHWRPGDARAARQILSADGREVELANLLAKAGVTIKGIAAQRLDELAAVLADGLERGESPGAIATALRGIVANPTWANTVAWTETARAQSAAASEIYRQRGVARNEWMTAHDQRVCPLCAANDAAGPVDVGSEFPSGDTHPPGHPRCRCALIPVLDDIGKSARAELTGRDQLHHYWTRGEGLAKWADHPHPWTALYHHLLKYLPDGEAKRTAAQWFRDVKGYWPGDQRGSNPVGPG